MSILKVARMGHPVLRQKARPIVPKELKTVLLQKFIDDMIETMQEYSGVGLAAPQVHESLRVFVAHLDPEGREPPAHTLPGGRTALGEHHVGALGERQRRPARGQLERAPVGQDPTAVRVAST